MEDAVPVNRVAGADADRVPFIVCQAERVDDRVEGFTRWVAAAILVGLDSRDGETGAAGDVRLRKMPPQTVLPKCAAPVESGLHDPDPHARILHGRILTDPDTECDWFLVVVGVRSA